MIDKKTQGKLEFDKIKNLLINQSYGLGGKAKIEAMKLSNDVNEIEELLTETEEAMELYRFSEPNFLAQLPIINSYLAKARVNGVLYGSELRDIYRIINAARLAGRQFDNKSNKYNRLSKYYLNLQVNLDLLKKIDNAIHEDGQIRDDASPELRNIRRKISNSRAQIKSYLQNFIHSSEKQKYLQDSLITERDGRYVVPVKQEHRSEVKGIIHDESASGATVFIEPLLVVEQNNLIRSLQNEEQREINRILVELSALVAVNYDDLLANQDILHSLDLIFSRARLAYKMNAYRPLINKNGVTALQRAKHPLLGENAVPINLQLGKKYDILVITGPNTGGKTVVLKTLGLLTLMTMAGLYIPAQERSQIAIYDHIYVDIGDEQSIEQSLSTFSSHMSNIISILKGARENSLVLLDELGAGTDPIEGAALARVILEELQQKNARVVVTTHQSELKNYAFQNQRVENACVEFDPVSLMPTYMLTIGMPGQSNAFSIAKRLGLSELLVNKAVNMVPQNEAEISNVMRQLKESHDAYERSNRELEAIKQELQIERNTLEEEKLKWQIEKEQLWEKEQNEIDSYVRKIRNEAEEAIKELKETLSQKQEPPKWHEVEKSRRKIKVLGSAQKPSAKREWMDSVIQAGDHVLIADIKQRGYVLSKQNNEYTVQVGNMRLNVKAEQIVKIAELEEKPKPVRNQSFLEKAQTIAAEIDLRGKMVEEALEIVDKYLDDAALVSLSSVRLIHGKGTGALRKAIQSHLGSHPLVGSFRNGNLNEGGHGVTVVLLK